MNRRLYQAIRSLKEGNKYSSIKAKVRRYQDGRFVELTYFRVRIKRIENILILSFGIRNFKKTKEAINGVANAYKIPFEAVGSGISPIIRNLQTGEDRRPLKAPRNRWQVSLCLKQQRQLKTKKGTIMQENKFTEKEKLMDFDVTGSTDGLGVTLVIKGVTDGQKAIDRFKKLCQVEYTTHIAVQR